MIQVIERCPVERVVYRLIVIPLTELQASFQQSVEMHGLLRGTAWWKWDEMLQVHHLTQRTNRCVSWRLSQFSATV
jgi:hypothetical protein